MAECTYSYDSYPETGWRVVTLTCPGAGPDEQTSASFSPDLGSNLFSFSVGGTEYLYPASDARGRTMLLGTPILYPTPNRVRDARMTFEGRTFEFEANNNGNFLHGLVRGIPWECDEPVASGDSISVATRIRFEPGTEIYDRFPIRNTLELVYTLRPSQISMVFTVRNEDDSERLPFGLAIHPFFQIIGERSAVRLLVPVEKWMEADNLLPSGRLLDLEQGPADLRTPTPLSELNLDDVFYGLDRGKPQVIYYDALGKALTLTADDFYTHTVVFTPPPSPFFCVENQSCSTDAHNLHAAGFTEAAHLAILEPGESHTSSIEFTVSDQ
jgi:aldose 1-epimerase